MLYQATKRLVRGFTRPNDANAYAAGDVIANSTTAGSVVYTPFPAVRRKFGGAILIGGSLYKSTNGTFTGGARLWLMTGAPAAYQGDNAAWAPTDADAQKIIGYADFGAGVAPGANNLISRLAFVANSGLGIGISDLDDGENLHWVLTALGAYTPAANEEFRISLEFDQD